MGQRGEGNRRAMGLRKGLDEIFSEPPSSLCVRARVHLSAHKFTPGAVLSCVLHCTIVIKPVWYATIILLLLLAVGREYSQNATLTGEELVSPKPGRAVIPLPHS